MDEDRIIELAKEAGKEGGREGAKETLRLLGADVDNPLEMQGDFRYLRSLRSNVSHIMRGGFYVLALGILSAIGRIVWASITGE